MTKKSMASPQPKKRSRAPRSKKSGVQGSISESVRQSVASWLLSSLDRKTAKTKEKTYRQGLALVLKSGEIDKVKKKLPEGWSFPSWQWEQIRNSKSSLFQVSCEKGPLWLIFFDRSQPFDGLSQEDNLRSSQWTQARDAAGQWWRNLAHFALDEVLLNLEGLKEEAILGFFVGLDMAAYRYRKVKEGQPTTPLSLHLKLPKSFRSAPLTQPSASLAGGINLARHLVNLPPSELNPRHFAQSLKDLFAHCPQVEVEIWEEAELKKQNMNLLLAVGKGSVVPPCFVQLRYHPKRGAKKNPIALVGKGITFDSGGLNIKPAGGMRLMKKDMGGAAALAGVCYWANQVNLNQPLHFYLPFSENSISHESFRPSDVIRSRSGLDVEIHNTDAEGRLVLADALDVAINDSPSPEMIIDVATLTGAVKVGLGAEVAGLFSNNKELRQKLLKSAQATGDWMWPMPLHQKYRSRMASSFADMTNAVDGFGGAINAALFLESFVDQKKWAHMDIYGWKDQPEGAWSEAGGSGQAVQCLTHFLSKY